ncbi:hypothetical protein [Rhizohabitans arisaemae]|uniref:hypothetical protein n=1 Tax=Rhizohabitans arisaemae TaxID=2720610 RepID=UPI0024B16BEB|nr:hypothetical protein [Rhizohabitans arisaemae]
MAFFRPRVSREAEVRYVADQELGKGFPERLATARQAEHAFRQAQADGVPDAELRARGVAFDRALTEALRVAEAAQRATFGVKAYDDRIRRRQAKATPDGRRWTDQVDRLRTLREEHRLRDGVRLPRIPA